MVLNENSKADTPTAAIMDNFFMIIFVFDRTVDV